MSAPPTSLPAWTRKAGVWAALGGAMSLLLALARFDPFLFTGGDNAHYYALAEALATGRGYVDLVTPGAPPHTQYPPGYPALLVPFYLLSNGSIIGLKLASWIAAGAVLGAVWRLGRRDPAIPDWIAAASVWAVGLFGAFQLYAHRVLSDMPYLALVAWTLVLVQPSKDGAGPDRVDARWLAGCGLALVAFSVRTAGITILAGLVAWALARRRWRRAAVAAATTGAALATWLAWTRRAAGGEAVYLEQLAWTNPLARGGGEAGWTRAVERFAERLGETVVEYAWFQLPQIVWPVDPPPALASVLVVTLGGALLGLGAWRAIRHRGLAPWDLYVAATLGLLPFWPWLGDRYVLALIPFLWFWILLGLDEAARRGVGGRATSVAATAVVVAILLGHAAAAVPSQAARTRAWLGGDRLAGYDAFWSDYFESARWIGEHAPEGAVVLARKPRLAWYWSRRPALVYPQHVPPDTQWRFIRRRGITHILFEPWTKEAIGEALIPHQHLLRQVHEAPRGGTLVFELVPGDPAP